MVAAQGQAADKLPIEGSQQRAGSNTPMSPTGMTAPATLDLMNTGMTPNRPPSSAAATTPSLTPGHSMTGATMANDSLLPIVSSQRERFRQRNLELEAVSILKVFLTERSADCCFCWRSLHEGKLTNWCTVMGIPYSPAYWAMPSFSFFLKCYTPH